MFWYCIGSAAALAALSAIIQEMAPGQDVRDATLAAWAIVHGYTSLCLEAGREEMRCRRRLCSSLDARGPRSEAARTSSRTTWRDASYNVDGREQRVSERNGSLVGIARLMSKRFSTRSIGWIIMDADRKGFGSRFLMKLTVLTTRGVCLTALLLVGDFITPSVMSLCSMSALETTATMPECRL